MTTSRRAIREKPSGRRAKAPAALSVRPSQTTEVRGKAGFSPCGSRVGLAARSGLGRAGGFTLVEMMVVIIVICVIVGAVAPEFSGTYARMQISSAAGRLGDMMAFCYSAAATRQTDYRMYFDPETARAWVERNVETETGEYEYEVVQFPGMQSYVLPETVRFDPDDMADTLTEGDEGYYYVQFRRDGRADFARVRLISLRANPVEISLNGLTGRVAIREMEPEELEAEGSSVVE